MTKYVGGPLGILIGSVVGGTLGDKFGRKLIMMLAAFITCPIMLGSGFIPNYGGEHVSIFHRGCVIFCFHILSLCNYGSSINHVDLLTSSPLCEPFF